ncbi:MAG: ABC transporter ATP-binding protein [Acidobacteriia bacterium]|nr:ABC transporter ATP-binding protein [Terriglobia bacterium]
MSCVIRFDRVTKSFVHHAGRMLLRERLRHLFHRAPAEPFYALSDVSFRVEAGESLGLIGGNGAGKSTILNLATGLVQPDSGTIEVRGRVAALLELGAGFHPDLTGAENVRINAALMGLHRREAMEKFEEIVDFSGIRESIHEPLRTYSSGMVMRLAFAVAVATEPDILLVDEVLGVGDEAFYQKCLERIREFQKAGKTVLLASHNALLIRNFCHSALWMDQGRVVASGKSAEVMDAYQESVIAAS